MFVHEQKSPLLLRLHALLSNKVDDQIVILFNSLIDQNKIQCGVAADVMFMLACQFLDNLEIRGAALTLLLNASQQYEEERISNNYFINHGYLMSLNDDPATAQLGRVLMRGSVVRHPDVSISSISVLVDNVETILNSKHKHAVAMPLSKEAILPKTEPSTAIQPLKAAPNHSALFKPAPSIVAARENVDEDFCVLEFRQQRSWCVIL